MSSPRLGPERVPRPPTPSPRPSEADSPEAKNDGDATQRDALAPQDEFDQRNSVIDNSQAGLKQDNDDLEQSGETSLSRSSAPGPSRADTEAHDAADTKRLMKVRRAEAD
jgi:hypothetical protein